LSSSAGRISDGSDLLNELGISKMEAKIRTQIKINDEHKN
jgi:hypothetical protein